MMEFLLEILFEILFEVGLEALHGMVKSKWIKRFLRLLFILVLLSIFVSLITLGAYLLSIKEFKEALCIFVVLTMLTIGVILQIKKIIHEREERQWNFME